MQPSLSPKIFIPLLLVLALMGAGLLLLMTTPYGPGLNPDSSGYLNDAGILAADLFQPGLPRLPSVFSPPLYPILLAVLSLISGADPLPIAHAVVVVLYALIIFSSSLLAFRILPLPPVILVLLTVAIAVSGVLARISLMALSEPLFIFLVLLSLILVDLFLANRDLMSLALFTLVVALAALTRYIGVTLILWGAIVILQTGREDRTKSVRQVALFLVVTMLPIALWLARNFVRTGTLMGPRYSSSRTLPENLGAVSTTLRDWYIPPGISDNGALFFIGGVTAVVLIALGLWRTRSRFDLQKIGPLLLFVIIYLLFLIISATTTAFDPIGSRLLSPIYIPLAMLFTYVVWLAAGALGGPRSSGPVVAFFAAGFLFWSASLGAGVVAEGRDLGWGLNSRQWRESETIQYVQQSPALMQCPLYSNMPWSLIIHTGLHAGWTPFRTQYASPQKAWDLSELRGQWPREDEVCLIWFDARIQPHLYDVADLGTIAHVEQIARLEDGAIYRVVKE